MCVFLFLFFLTLLYRCLTMVYKLNKTVIKLVQKIETRNRPAYYTIMFQDSDLNFFAARLFRNA